MDINSILLHFVSNRSRISVRFQKPYTNSQSILRLKIRPVQGAGNQLCAKRSLLTPVGCFHRIGRLLVQGSTLAAVFVNQAKGCGQCYKCRIADRVKVVVLLLSATLLGCLPLPDCYSLNPANYAVQLVKSGATTAGPSFA